MLLTRHNNESFSNQIVTCEEKWNQHNSRKHSAQWLDKDEPTKYSPKSEIHERKLIVCVWGPGACIFYNDFVKLLSTITAKIFCCQFDAEIYTQKTA